MSTSEPSLHRRGLGYATAVIAVAIGLIGVAALLYFLLDILLIFFLGIVVAAALQPAHLWLAEWGVPKGLAVLLIYFVFLLVIALIALFVGPVLFEQISTLINDVPELYAQFVTTLQTSSLTFVQQLSRRLPQFGELTGHLSAVLPSFVDDFVQFITNTVSFFSYFIIVLAIGFYWTIEVPRLERLVVSLVPVNRRAQILEIWHEIESKLGAFIRGQGLAMLIIGVASGLGYWFIGLPNVLVLAVLAGLMEAVPIIGPILAAVPAILVALSQGMMPVLFVIGFSMLLQLFENNVLLPRIMNHAVGISSLVGLFAVLACGTLYGTLGVFIAIPLAVVVHVLLDHILINPELSSERDTEVDVLRVRIQDLHQQLRTRLRARESRIQMGTDAQTVDQVADNIDQQLEKAVERMETVLAVTQDDKTSIPAEKQQTIASEVARTAGNITQVVQQVDTILPVTKSEEAAPNSTLKAPLVSKLQQATQKAERAVEQAEEALNQVQENDQSLTPPPDNSR